MSTVQDFKNFPVPQNEEELTNIMIRRWKEFNATLANTEPDTTVVTTENPVTTTSTVLTTVSTATTSTTSTLWSKTEQIVEDVVSEISKSI